MKTANVYRDLILPCLRMTLPYFTMSMKPFRTA